MTKELVERNNDQTENCMTLIESKAEQARTVIVELINSYFSQEDEDESVMALRLEHHKVQMFIEIVENLLGQIGGQCAEWNEWYQAMMAAKRNSKVE